MINKYIIKSGSTVFLLMILLFTSCSTSLSEFNNEKGDNEFVFHSQLEIAAPKLINTRNTETRKLESLRLLVFDENNSFLYSRVAVLGGFDEKTQSFSYSVKLISSAKKRYVHFIANHNWINFEQDYFLEGLDAGYIIGRLVTKQCAYWGIAELNGLNSKTLGGAPSKLMSNEALIRVESNAPDFQFDGFKIYNAYDRGTVASFEVDEKGQVRFFKDLKQLKPTIPSDYKVSVVRDFQLTPAKAFERFAVNGRPPFVLIKGTHKGIKDCYYKVDLKKFDPATGVTQLYDILRNHAYNIKITRVMGFGYDTEQKAVEAPASNNIFASIELENYSAITNGKHELVVDKLTQTLVGHPYTFETKVRYTEGLNKVKYYPSWEANDPYLEPLDEKLLSRGEIRVRTKRTPKDRTIIRTIDIVASSNGQDQDIITRQVKLILEPPYNFKAYHYIEHNGDVTVRFTLSQKLDDSVYPLEVFIKTDKLTPITSKNGSNMVLVYKNGAYVYKFSFRERPKKEEQVLYFKKNDPADHGLGSIVLSCFYFLDDDASHLKD